MRIPPFRFYATRSGLGVMRKREPCHGPLRTIHGQQWRDVCSAPSVAYRWSAYRRDEDYVVMFSGSCATHATLPEREMFFAPTIYSPWLPFEEAARSLLEDCPRQIQVEDVLRA